MVTKNVCSYDLSSTCTEFDVYANEIAKTLFFTTTFTLTTTKASVDIRLKLQLQTLYYQK